MSAEIVVLSCDASSFGQQFVATVKVRGEYFDAATQPASGSFITGAPLDHPWHQALKKAGIEPYSMHTEAELRAALITIGLSEEEVEIKFQSARKFKSTITVHK
jgi:hypothetical protein